MWSFEVKTIFAFFWFRNHQNAGFFQHLKMTGGWKMTKRRKWCKFVGSSQAMHSNPRQKWLRAISSSKTTQRRQNTVGFFKCSGWLRGWKLIENGTEVNLTERNAGSVSFHGENCFEDFQSLEKVKMLCFSMLRSLNMLSVGAQLLLNQVGRAVCQGNKFVFCIATMPL